jgi:hypothetical protein
MQKLANLTDRSGRVIPLTFLDESGNEVVPNAGASWTLTDGVNIINAREDVPIDPLASTVYITLGAADTDYAGGARRVLVAEGEYLSSLTGGNVPVRAGAWFRIEDLPE